MLAASDNVECEVSGFALHNRKRLQWALLGSLVRRRSAPQVLRFDGCEHMSRSSQCQCLDRADPSATCRAGSGDPTAATVSRPNSSASVTFIPLCNDCKGRHDLCFVCEEGNGYMAGMDGPRGSLGQLLRTTLERLGSGGRSRKASERSDYSCCAASGGALSSTFPFELDVVDIEQ